jgi:hypothetical protein
MILLAEGEEQRNGPVVREIRRRCERGVGDIHLRPYRDMSGYDHELTFSLTLVKFIDQPVVSFLVQTSPRVGTIFGVGIRFARVVEHYDLEGHACLGLEGVGGEVVIEISLRESVAIRF